jgi:hypothetical protein
MEPRGAFCECEEARDRMVSRFLGVPLSGLSSPQTWTPLVDVEKADYRRHYRNWWNSTSSGS